MTIAVRTNNPEDTERVGEKLAAGLQAGAVIALRGGLGAGKTAFVRGLARGLGYPGQVTSPTFALVGEYEGGRLPLFHFDLYRVEHADELLDLGCEDYLARGGVCAVEWSERAGQLFDSTALTVTLIRGETESERVITIAQMQATTNES